MPCGYGVGDHRLFIVDFLTSSMVGSTPVKVVRPAAQRLNTRLPYVTESYTKRFKSNVKRHRLLEKLEATGKEDVTNEEAGIWVNSIDRDSKQYMRNAEKKCQKIKSGNIPFTPETAALLWRRQVYQ